MIAEQRRARRIWSNTDPGHWVVWARDARAAQGVQELSRHEDSRQAEGESGVSVCVRDCWGMSRGKQWRVLIDNRWSIQSLI